MEDVAALKETIALQAEEVAMLRRELGLQPDADRLVRTMRLFGLTRARAQILLALGTGRLMSRDNLYDAYSGHRIDDRGIRIIDVFISKMRPALREKGIVIETIWGQGYRLTSHSKNRLNELLEA